MGGGPLSASGDITGTALVGISGGADGIVSGPADGIGGGLDGMTGTALVGNSAFVVDGASGAVGISGGADGIVVETAGAAPVGSSALGGGCGAPPAPGLS